MVVYLVIKNEYYVVENSEYVWYVKDGNFLFKEEFKGMLRRLYNIWFIVVEDVVELRKIVDMFVVMLVRFGEFVVGLLIVIWKVGLIKVGEFGIIFIIGILFEL